MKIALIGGHGKVALLATPLLAQAGHDVVSIIRNPAHVADVEKAGATAHVADIESMDQHAWNELLSHDFDAVIWSAGAGGGSAERTWKVDFESAKRSMVAAVRAGIKKYVMVSFIGSSLLHTVPENSSFWTYAQAKAEADAFLHGSGLNYLILGPSTLTLDNPSERIDLVEHSAQKATNGTEQHGYTSRANVARMIVAAVQASDEAYGKTYDFIDGSTPIAEVFARN